MSATKAMEEGLKINPGFDEGVRLMDLIDKNLL
jgi:hypothetical protein